MKKRERERERKREREKNKEEVKINRWALSTDGDYSTTTTTRPRSECMYPFVSVDDRIDCPNLYYTILYSILRISNRSVYVYSSSSVFHKMFTFLISSSFLNNVPSMKILPFIM